MLYGRLRIGAGPCVVLGPENTMLDLLFLVVLLFGCVSSLAYVSGCERL